jgi:nucleoside-diphosphate-sugar epimerase
MLEDSFEIKLDISYDDWRLSDQKCYISDIRYAKHMLKWAPTISPREGLLATAEWVKDNLHIF